MSFQFCQTLWYILELCKKWDINILNSIRHIVFISLKGALQCPMMLREQWWAKSWILHSYESQCRNPPDAWSLKLSFTVTPTTWCSLVSIFFSTGSLDVFSIASGFFLFTFNQKRHSKLFLGTCSGDSSRFCIKQFPLFFFFFLRS